MRVDQAHMLLPPRPYKGPLQVEVTEDRSGDEWPREKIVAWTRRIEREAKSMPIGLPPSAYRQADADRRAADAVFWVQVAVLYTLAVALIFGIFTTMASPDGFHKARQHHGRSDFRTGAG